MGISESNLKPEAHAFTAQHLTIEKDKPKKEIYRCQHCKKDGAYAKTNAGYYTPISDPSDHRRELSGA
jgi:hypothetical protein